MWHVDDLKISHEDPEIVTSYINKLDKKYGKDAYGNSTPLTVKRGLKHEYLGMTLDFSDPLKVRIDMTK